MPWYHRRVSPTVVPTGRRSPARRRVALALAAGASAWLAREALAQVVRAIPESAELGRMAIGVFPEATLDGRPIRLGAGARIRDEHNVIRPPSTVAGERRVAYRRGTMGEINEVWLLTDTEYRSIVAARRAAASRR